jgi:hypothetical protein
VPKYTVAVARFPYQNQECPDSTDWLVATVSKMNRDPRIEHTYLWRVDDTPITMTRNCVLKRALEKKVDYLVMLDSDMAPDCEPDGKPFWDTTWEFTLKHEGPCIVGAPYCGPPPVNNVYVFRWANLMNDNPTFDGRLEQYTREEAGIRGGFEKVAALPTGLILIDMRAIDRLSPDHPPFYYEWADAWQTKKGSTEDVAFTRDLSVLKVPLYCNWDAWAGHWKRYLVRKPRPMTAESVGENLRAACLRTQKQGEKLVLVGEGEPPPPPSPYILRGKTGLPPELMPKPVANTSGFQGALYNGDIDVVFSD